MNIVIVFRPRLEGILRRLKRGQVVTSLVPFSTNGRIGREFASGAVDRLIGTYFSVKRIGAKTLVMVRRGRLLASCVEANVGLSTVLADRLLVGVFRRGAPLRSKTIVMERGEVITTAYCLPLSSGVRLDGRLKAQRETNIKVDRRASSIAVVMSRRANRMSMTRKKGLAENMGDTGLERVLIETRGGRIMSGDGLHRLLGKEIGRRRTGGGEWCASRGRIYHGDYYTVTSHYGCEWSSEGRLLCTR